MAFVTGLLLFVVAVQAATIVAVLVDRARGKHAVQVQRESEARFRVIADRVPVMIWTARPDTTLDYLNGYCAAFTGLPIAKLRDEGWLDAVHPDDRDRCMGIYGPAFEARTAFVMEYRARRADGAFRWLLASGVPMHASDGSFAGFVGCDVDITERRESEDRILAGTAALEASTRETRKLAGRLIEAQDAERARVARDLHDDVSQQLAGLSIALSGLRRSMEQSHAAEELQVELSRLHQRAAVLAQNVRHLSHDLHPTVLRHAGLVATLTSHCRELERLHGTKLMCTVEGNFATIAPEAALCLYRVGQEALRNVIAHAASKWTDVRLVRTDDYAEITIIDDGTGFDVALSLDRGKGLGLLSMTERVKLAGGTVSVESELERGTRICARVPLLAANPTSGSTHPRVEEGHRVS